MDEKGAPEALLRRARMAVDHAREAVHRSAMLLHLSDQIRNRGLTSRCAWCGRHQVGEEWVALNRMPRFGTFGPQSHTICPDCVEELRKAGKSV
jgi:hypothetical protein